MKDYTDQWFKAGFIAAGLFVIYAMGVAAQLYGVWPATLYRGALNAYETYTKRSAIRSADTERYGRYRNEESVLEAAVIERQGEVGAYTLLCKDDLITVLLDPYGKVVHRWDARDTLRSILKSESVSPDELDNVRCGAAQLMPGGDLIAAYHVLAEPEYGFGLLRLNKSSEKVWFANIRAHDDVYVTDNKTIYTLTHTYYARPNRKLKELHTPAVFDGVEVLSPEGKSLRKISLAQAFVGTPYEGYLLSQPPIERVMQAVSVMPLSASLQAAFPQFSEGDLLVSLKGMHTIAVINGRGKVVWAMRGPWRSPGAARFMPNGHILLVDSEGMMDHSRLIELDPVSRSMVWHYEWPEKFFTDGKAGLQLRPGGNVLVTQTRHAETGSGAFFELDAEGKPLMYYQIELPIADAQRYDATYFSQRFCADIGCTSPDETKE